MPASATVFFSTLRPYDPQDQLLQTVLPMMGAIFTALGAFWLNPENETRKIVAGRATFGLLAGTAAPSIIIAIAPNVIPESWGWIVEVMRWPGALIILGGAVAFVFYILSRPFCANAYDKAGAVAKAQVDRLVEAAKGPNNTVIILDPAKVPSTKLES